MNRLHLSVVAGRSPRRPLEPNHQRVEPLQDRMLGAGATMTTGRYESREPAAGGSRYNREGRLNPARPVTRQAAGRCVSDREVSQVVEPLVPPTVFSNEFPLNR